MKKHLTIFQIFLSECDTNNYENICIIDLPALELRVEVTEEFLFNDVPAQVQRQWMGVLKTSMRHSDRFWFRFCFECAQVPVVAEYVHTLTQECHFSIDFVLQNSLSSGHSWQSSISSFEAQHVALAIFGTFHNSSKSNVARFTNACWDIIH